MGKKTKINPDERPHPILEAMLQGPKVPEGFVCDGCTSSPDLHFVWACNIHDYESKMSSENWAELIDATDNMWDRVSIKVYIEDSGNYEEKTVPIKQGFQIWYRQFDGMAYRLNHNIKILSRWDVKEGQLISRSRMNPKRLMGYKLSRWYARATSKWATKWAE